MDKLKLAEQTIMGDEHPDFKSGDRVNVHYRVREGEKERIQQFEGTVIARRGSGANRTFIVRKIGAGNIGVERIFPLHSPFIAKIELVREGDVRRSKLYYLRDLRGKAARIKEKDNQLFQTDTNNKEESAKAEQQAKEETPVEEELSSSEEE